MLKSLTLKNLAVFADAQLEFGQGLNVITGETGSGKSILMQALFLLAGGKVSASTVRSGSTEATVLLQVELNQHAGLLHILEELGISAEEELLLRRVLNQEGKSKAFVNDVPVTLNALAKITAALFHLTRQHEYVRLLDRDTPRFCIDQKLQAQVKAFKTIFLDYLQFQKRSLAFQSHYEASRKQEDFLRFQLEELTKAQLRAGEEAELETEKAKLKNIAKISQTLTQVLGMLGEEETCVQHQLGRVNRDLEKLVMIVPSFAEPARQVSQCLSQLDEVYRQLQNECSVSEDAPARLDQIESRLALLHELKRKYHLDLSALIQKRQEIEDSLQYLDHHDEKLQEFKTEEQGWIQKLTEHAKKISNLRKKAALDLSRVIQNELHGLGLPKARFEIVVKAGEHFSEMKETGWDEVEFWISMNPGQKLVRLAEAASGGELSRILLSLRQLLYPSEWKGALIFDEIDQGIGGGVAELVGQKLNQLAKDRQVICVTHLSQIAAFAPHHFRVEKCIAGQQTKSFVQVLSHEDKVKEMARMLTGIKISEKALSHAREMLKNSAA